MASLSDSSDKTPPAIGIEIADSATRFTAQIASEGTPRRWHTRLTAPATPESALDQINALIARVLQERALPSARVAVGVALPAQVDAAQGIILEMRPLPAWQNVPLAVQLSERWGLPARIENTTNAAALAEMRQGAGKRYDSALYVSLSRSVTSAFVLHSEIWHGAHAAAGMFGHTLVAPGGPRCSCGVAGHLDPLASAQSLVRRFIGRASASDENTAAMLRASAGRAEAISATQVVRLAADGDDAAREVVKSALDALALALANALALLDPAIIVIGGPLTEAGAAFLEPLHTRLSALASPFMVVPPVVAGNLDPWAALHGAAALAIPVRH